VTQGTERQLDDLDAAIFAALQQDGRRGFRALGRELDVPEETVRFRVNRMLRDGVVQITAMIHPRHLGGVLATLLIKVALPHRAAAIEAIEAMAPVMYLSVCSGRFDLDVQVVVKDLDDLNRLVGEELSTIEGVEDVETLIELDVVKAHYGFPALDLRKS
jgi:Lrp/AsnC family transcriptional regulator for asnA, asnC and gidA